MMYSRYGKKGKNLGSVDSWLDTLGYYRKNVAYDETCLFRAVSEQMFYSQIYHEEIRKQCIEYGKLHYNEFSHYVDSEDEWFDRLQNLEVHMLICGDVEIQLISKTYKRDILVFDAVERHLQDVTNVNKSSDALLICKISDDHYDVVYKRDHIATAGFCQSVVYKMLYENVFDIPDVTQIVNSMLYKPDSVTGGIQHSEYFNEHNSLCEENTSPVDDDLDVKNEFGEPSVPQKAPFPFKVAKALDPNIYRNIEYDTWVEIRRELRLGEWYLGDENLILGAACVLKEGHEKLSCYVQDILKKENKCVVYITNLAERRTVLYTDLMPEDDAKPWPLPYRFSKSLAIQSSETVLTERDSKTVRKRKDKRRIKTISESSAHSGHLHSSGEVADVNHSVYEGCPLQMQTTTKYTPDSENNMTVEEEVTQNVQVTEGQLMQWDPQWPPLMSPPLMPQIIWNQPPKPKPLQIPGPTNEPQKLRLFCTSYNGEIYGQTGVWPNPEYMSPDQGYVQSDFEEPSPGAETYNNPNKYVYFSPESAYTSPATLSSPQNERIIYNTPAAISPQVDIYPYMYPTVHPGTPVYYTPPPLPPPRPADMIVSPPPLPVFSPSVEMQYIAPSPYAYSTPPATWYPANVTSHGFVYPTIHPQQPNVQNIG